MLIVIVVVVLCGWGALLLAIELCTYTLDCTLTEWFDLLGLETTLLTYPRLPYIIIIILWSRL